MDISSVGTSSSLKELLAMLGVTTTSSTTSMDAESLTSLSSTGSDSLEISSAGQSMSADANPLKADMEQLGKLIESGDLEGAQQLYETIKERMQAHQAGGQEGEDPMASCLDDIGEALESGDSDKALSAWNTLQSKLESFGSGRPDDATSSTTSSASTMSTTDLNALLLSAYSQQSQLLSGSNATTTAS